MYIFGELTSQNDRKRNETTENCACKKSIVEIAEDILHAICILYHIVHIHIHTHTHTHISAFKLLRESAKH